MRSRQATAAIERWIAAPALWMPEPGPSYWTILRSLVERNEVRANLVSDAYLTALAIEHGLDVVSADTDFARFAEITWSNPLQPGPV